MVLTWITKIYNLAAVIDCEWSEWQIGECTTTCTRTNNRTKKVEESSGGKCDGETTLEEPCNTQDCSGKFSIFRK